MEPFLKCQFNFFRDLGPLTPTKNARIRHVGVGGEDVIQVWWEKGNSLPSHSVIKRLVYLVFWMLLSGESKEKKKQVRFDTKQNCKKYKWWVHNNFRFSHFRMESSVHWSEVLFEGVWKLTFPCRLFYSSSFEASFPVSTKEFLWDFSFNAKL